MTYLVERGPDGLRVYGEIVVFACSDVRPKPPGFLGPEPCYGLARDVAVSRDMGVWLELSWQVLKIAVGFEEKRK